MVSYLCIDRTVITDSGCVLFTFGRIEFALAEIMELLGAPTIDLVFAILHHAKQVVNVHFTRLLVRTFVEVDHSTKWKRKTYIITVMTSQFSPTVPTLFINCNVEQLC